MPAFRMSFGLRRTSGGAVGLEQGHPVPDDGDALALAHGRAGDLLAVFVLPHVLQSEVEAEEVLHVGECQPSGSGCCFVSQ